MQPDGVGPWLGLALALTRNVSSMWLLEHAGWEEVRRIGDSRGLVGGTERLQTGGGEPGVEAGSEDARVRGCEHYL